MAGKPINLQDIEKLELNKIDKSQIKNTLTETEIGNVLDATQGKVLDDKISVLNGKVNSIKIYSTLADFGITDKFSTIEECVLLMGNNSLLVTETYVLFSDLSIFPSTGYGILTIDSYSQQRTKIEYVEALEKASGVTKIWIASFRNASTPKYDWQQIATTTDTTALDDKINVLSSESIKYIGNITTFSQVDKTGYYTIAACLDDTIPVQYGTLRAYLDGSEKTVEATGHYGSDIVQCSAAYNNNTKQWKWKQVATTDAVKYLNNQDNWNTGNTTPKDYLNVMKPNGARTYHDLGISVDDGYWCNVFGINNYNGDTGVTELAFTDKGKIFFRTQVGVAKMENWNNTHWKQLATTTKTQLSLVNGWVVNDWRTCEITRVGQSVNGIIHMKGGTQTYGTTITTLPSQFIPTANKDCIGLCHNGSGWIPCIVYITTDGIVGVYDIPSNLNVVIPLSYSI